MIAKVTVLIFLVQLCQSLVKATSNAHQTKLSKYVGA